MTSTEDLRQTSFIIVIDQFLVVDSLTHSFFPPSTFQILSVWILYKKYYRVLESFVVVGCLGVVNKLPLKFTCYLANKVVFPQPANEHSLFHYLETTSEKEVNLNCNHGAIQEICKFPCRRGHHH